MKKILILFGLILCFAGLWGQTPYDTVNVYDPQNFTEMTTIDPANGQIISRKNSLNRRINFDTLRNYVTPAVLHAWLGDPLDSTNVLSTYWRQFVTDSLGRVWYVDADGDAKMLKDTTITGVSDGDKGDITVSGSGGTWNIDAGVVGANEIASTAVTPGSYTRTSLTVDADGRITAASNGTSDADGNGIISALPAGDVAIIGEGNLLTTVSNRVMGTTIHNGKNFATLYVTDSLYNATFNPNWGGIGLIGIPSVILSAKQGIDSAFIVIKPKYTNITSDTLDATGVTTFLGFPTTTDTDNQTIDTFTIVSNTLRLSLQDDAQAFKSVSLASYLDNTDAQTISHSSDSLTLSGGNTTRTPGNGFIRDSITGATLTVDLKKYNNAYVEIRMESTTNVTLTISNPWSALTDATYPTFKGQSGCYVFHFMGTSGTDNVTWPTNFYDSAGTELGTDALTSLGTMYTCIYNPVRAGYYCK